MLLCHFPGVGRETYCFANRSTTRETALPGSVFSTGQVRGCWRPALDSALQYGCAMQQGSWKGGTMRGTISRASLARCFGRAACAALLTVMIGHAPPKLNAQSNPAPST